jgi:uncharacterized protein (TIGR02147 family)
MAQRKPNHIDHYTDYRRFLIEELKRRDQSRLDLAQALGLSHSMMSQVLTNKRKLRPTLVPTLADFLGLDDDERHMLAALVDLDNESDFARQSAWAAVQARQRYLAEQTPPEDLVVAAFGRWFVAAIYELASCEDFKADPRWIAQTLNPPITAEEAEDALQTLLTLGMLQPSRAGQLEPVPQEVWADGRLPAGAISQVVYKQHLAALENAARAYTVFQQNERHSGVVTFAVSEARYEQLLAKARQLERELVVLAIDEDVDPPNRVYQVCINMYPVSDYTDE